MCVFKLVLKFEFEHRTQEWTTCSCDGVVDAHLLCFVLLKRSKNLAEISSAEALRDVLNVFLCGRWGR